MMPIRCFVAFLLLTTSLLAQTTWTSFADRRGHAMAATPTGGVVMFGGESVSTPGEFLGDTNQLSTNNLTWTEAGIGGSAPPPTASGAMAATTISGANRYIFFGGVSPTGVVGGTWSWNGTAWGDLTPANPPQARSGHAMVTNTATNTMFLFGGFDGIVAKDDVWEFAPQTDSWTLRNPGGAGPSPRYGQCMAFHPHGGGTNGRIYVFGGSSFDDETWEFNPYTSAWTQLFPAVSPPGRFNAAMAYVTLGSRIVMFGGLGLGGSGATLLGDTWAFTRSGPTGTPVWTPVTTLPAPPGRYEHALTADSTGNNLVLFGGTSAVPPGSGPGAVIEGTWLYSVLGGWTEQLRVPSARDGAAMAYDSTRNRHVVFGGRTVPGSADLDETWEIDGLNWRQRTPTTRPSPRSDAGMVFDVARNRTVLYGGRDGGGDRNDTWEWTASLTTGSWSPVSTAQTPPAASGVQPVFDTVRNKTWMLVGSDMWKYDGAWSLGQSARPSPRYYAAHAWDSGRGRLVMFGGLDASSASHNDTWEWDGNSWQQRFPVNAPGTRFGAAMAYDPVRQVVAMFGGVVSTGNPIRLSEVWEWTGSNPGWNGGPLLTPLVGCGWDYHPTPSGIVLFGGGAISGPVDVMHRWSGGWTTLSPSVRPPARNAPVMVLDPIRSRLVLFGGEAWASAFHYGDTWEFDGTSWTQLFPSQSPPPRAVAQGAYDPHTGTVLMFGGIAFTGAILNDTWLWNGTNWQLQTPSTTPPGRMGAVCFRTATSLFLWGGAPGYSGELWEWSGSNWVLTDSGAPSPRSHYGAAYDVRRDRVVVFGGQSTTGPTTYNNQTFEWDGDSWLQRSPANSPSPRSRCKLTYDEARARVVLYGGTNGTSNLQDTWEWDGTNWAQRSPTAIPPGSSTHDLTFDQVRKLSIAFGSFGTWDYGAIHPSTTTTYGAGCASSAGSPFALKIQPWTGAWSGETFEMEFDNAPFGIGLFFWGFDYTTSLLGPLPIPLNLLGVGPASCFLRNSFDVIEVFLGTTYSSPIFANVSPSLLGVRLYGQGAFFDGGLPGIPIVTTDGAEFVIGQK